MGVQRPSKESKEMGGPEKSAPGGDEGGVEFQASGRAPGAAQAGGPHTRWSRCTLRICPVCIWSAGKLSNVRVSCYLVKTPWKERAKVSNPYRLSSGTAVPRLLHEAPLRATAGMCRTVAGLRSRCAVGVWGVGVWGGGGEGSSFRVFEGKVCRSKGALKPRLHATAHFQGRGRCWGAWQCLGVLAQ